jgi:hypothetical protein
MKIVVAKILTGWSLDSDADAHRIGWMADCTDDSVLIAIESHISKSETSW